jgi:hypothetical protein
LPNATPQAYIPKDRPAIGNLMTMFDFKDPHYGTVKLPLIRAPHAAAVHLPVVPITER